VLQLESTEYFIKSAIELGM